MLYFDYNEYIKEGICFMLIQDDALRSVIARTLRVKEDELTEDMMKELVHLEVQDHEIETLEGLQYAENLETLNASNNKLQTLDPIKDLHNLVCLNVSRNQLRDLQALHGFRQLKKLNISRNNLYTMDISSVAAMIDLEVLNLSKAKVDSLIYLEHCKKLEEVHINTENGPFSYAILGVLKKLKKLDMGGMRLFNIEDLTYLSNIEELDLNTNLMSDLTPLLSMKNLKKLNVSNCPYLKDYSILKEFSNLKSLNISYNEPEHFTFLKELNHLESLSMEQTGFKDMSLLNNLGDLKELNVSKTA